MYKFIEEKEIQKEIWQPSVVVYTCNYNDYDWLGNINYFHNAHNILFTDKPIDLPLEVVISPQSWKYNKIHASLFASKYDWSIYYDCNIKFKINPVDLIRNLQTDQVVTVKTEKCIYQKEDHDLLKKYNIPVGTPYYEDFFIMRRHTQEIKEMERLWEETGSFSVALYLSQIKITAVNFYEKLLSVNAHKKLNVPILWG